MTLLLTVALLSALLALLLGIANLARYRPPPEWHPQPDDANGPLISVCVPARNEAGNLDPCVRSLLAQQGVQLEVLVYDDQSDDETPRILHRLVTEDSRVRRVPTVALPEGWNGKQWGCDRMGRAARGEWLLFTDADVRFEAQCLVRTLAEAKRSAAACVSTFPRQVTGSLGEALLVPLIHFVLLSYLPIGRMRATLDPATSAGCGQFLFVQRDAWLAIGGHGAFPGSMHDGIKLPRALRRGGFRTDLFDGTELVRCRMYQGMSAVWRGFTKNAYEGLGSPVLLVLFTLLHLIGHVVPWVVVLWAVVNGATPWQWILALAAISAALLERALLARRFKQSWLSVLLHPVGMTLMTLVQWWSAWLHVSGRRTWRGRVATSPTS